MGSIPLAKWRLLSCLIINANDFFSSVCGTDGNQLTGPLDETYFDSNMFTQCFICKLFFACAHDFFVSRSFNFIWIFCVVNIKKPSILFIFLKFTCSGENNFDPPNITFQKCSLNNGCYNWIQSQNLSPRYKREARYYPIHGCKV